MSTATQQRRVKPHAVWLDDQGRIIMEVVEPTERLGPGGDMMKVVIESARDDFSQGIEELKSPDAKHLALKYAAGEGIGEPRINGNTGHPYAVNSNGQMIDQSLGYPNHAPEMQVARYRTMVPIVRKLL